MTSKPLEEWQIELMPYFEFVWIHSCSICEGCSESVEFESKYERFSDGYWFDEAKAMKKVGWVVPNTSEVYCKKCADVKRIKHNPKAYALTEL